MDVETFLCQSRKKISFSKINLLNLGKNLVGPWGSTQLGERSPKPVSRPKSDTRKVSRPSGPQNRPTCTCSTLPRASARHSPLEMVSSYLFTSIVSPSRRALGFCVRLRSMRAPLAPRRHCSATALFRTISACSYAPLFSSVSLFGGIGRQNPKKRNKNV